MVTSAVQVGLKGTGDISNTCVFQKLNSTAKSLSKKLLDLSCEDVTHPVINNFPPTIFANPAEFSGGGFDLAAALNKMVDSEMLNPDEFAIRMNEEVGLFKCLNCTANPIDVPSRISAFCTRNSKGRSQYFALSGFLFFIVLAHLNRVIQISKLAHS